MALTPAQDTKLTVIADGIRDLKNILSDDGRVGSRTHRTLEALIRDTDETRGVVGAVRRIEQEVTALAAAPPPDLTGAALDQAIEVLTALRARVP